MRQINLSKIMDSLKIKKDEINQTETINNSSKDRFLKKLSHAPANQGRVKVKQKLPQCNPSLS